MTGGTLCTKPEYNLDELIALSDIHDALTRWKEGGWKTQALMLCGLGGLGKTELACALMEVVAPAGALHFIKKIDRLRDLVFSPGEVLVVDEFCFADTEVDDLKSLLDLARGRDVECRNRDGHIPARTPRIFSTNWPRDILSPGLLQAPRMKVRSNVATCLSM